MDGTLIHASVPAASQTAFRSRKAIFHKMFSPFVILTWCSLTSTLDGKGARMMHLCFEMRSIAPTVFRFYHLENTILLMPVLRIILLFSHLIEVADIICKNGHVVGETWGAHKSCSTTRTRGLEIVLSDVLEFSRGDLHCYGMAWPTTNSEGKWKS